MRPRVFCYSALVMFFIVLLIYGIFRKIFMTSAVATALVLAIGYIHIAKFNFRGMPLLPEDFQLGSQAGTLTKFVDFSEIVRLIIAIILCIVLGKILDKLTEKWLKNQNVPSSTWWRKWRVASRVMIIAVALTGLLTTTDFARHHSGEREIALPILDSKFTDWNQVQNYAENGFLLGFLYNFNRLQISAPDGYSAEKIAEIKTELAAKKEAADISREELSDYNIVLILNESFMDPSKLAGNVYEISGGDVTPNLHRLQNEVLSGTMFSTDYGGGTANIEYEVVTGLTNYWFKTVPYTNLLPHQKSGTSVATFVRENGYQAAALHPFNGGMYKREIVLPKLGFDTLIFEPEFSRRGTYGESEYVRDSETYAELIDLLQKTEEPMLVSTMTMQNHAPYNTGMYGETNFKVSAGDGVSDDERNAIETYLMTLHESDRALGEFYEELMTLDEKTVVLFYGDHSPGVFTQVIQHVDKAVSDSARQTPYLIFANFELDPGAVISALKLNDFSETDAGRVSGAVLPRTTPNCLTNTLFNVLNAKRPLVHYLLDEICTDEPILTDVYFDTAAPFMSTALSEYNLLTYDIVAGEQYFLK